MGGMERKRRRGRDMNGTNGASARSLVRTQTAKETPPPSPSHTPRLGVLRSLVLPTPNGAKQSAQPIRRPTTPPHPPSPQPHRPPPRP
eukprot:3860946-Pleurochrysis_carterae.AAC.1